MGSFSPSWKLGGRGGEGADKRPHLLFQINRLTGSSTIPRTGACLLEAADLYV